MSLLGFRRPLISSLQVLALALLLLAPLPGLAFKVVEPKAESKLTSGGTVNVQVDLGRDFGIVKVRYYWYGELDEVLVSQEEATSVGEIVKPAALVADESSTPPFGGKLRVPSDAIGVMRLLAVAEVSRGRLDSRSVFDEILVDVRPSADLKSIDFKTDKPLRFGSAGREQVYASIDSLGKTYVLPVVGVYSDDVVRPIRLPATGTTYRSSDPKVVKVYPNGLLQLMGNGRAMVVASNGGKEGNLEVLIEVPEDANEPPEADAGPNRSVKSRKRVLLNGLRSLDPEGGPLRYHWSQIRGAKIALLDPNMPKASFQAPDVSEPKLFRFSLRVTDLKEADSLPAFVDITVVP